MNGTNPFRVHVDVFGLVRAMGLSEFQVDLVASRGCRPIRGRFDQPYFGLQSGIGGEAFALHGERVLLVGSVSQ